MDARTPIETVYRDAALLLRWRPGSTRRMVVVFTGRHSGFGGEPLDEFAATASCGGENAVLFVTDRDATWFSAPDLWRRIVAMVKEVRASERVEEIVTLGNSMGGYGALLLPRDVDVRRAIAFAPQVSLVRAETGDARWPEPAALPGPLPVADLGAAVARARTRCYLLAGAGCAADVAHLRLVPEGRRVHRWVLPGVGHNVARGLKEAGMLGEVVAAIVRGRRARVDALLGAPAEAVA